MKQPQFASQYVDLGTSLQYLAMPRFVTATQYAETVTRFVWQLAGCDMPLTRQVATSLCGISFPSDPATGQIDPTAAAQFEMTIGAIRNALILEANGKPLLLLDTAGVSARLRALDAPTLKPAQKLLLDETVACIECGSYHAATVMGWNLAYDFIRDWIFSKHLASFNTSLVATYQRRGQPKYDPISSYDDFFSKDAPSEREVLDTAKDCGAIGGAVHDHLCQYLRHRNDSAHPTDKVLTRDQTNAYIENLIELITRPPFK